ncbi:MAG: RnfABCDGE type electron transport complex subunit G [Dysgonamonadaceae bacterium]|nr:RnfABCDGE type electron transport complex subunit G [Dysgonamonadaceae bacterium]MDD4727199.1 RnfABCDGE type electron transport complex subunit G [Dysgonamonadaceae bacterium]
MAKLSSTFKNMLLSLFFICLLAAGLLAKVNDMTKEPIADAKALKLEEAIKDVVPDFDNNPVTESYKVATDSGDSLLVYPAKKGEEVVGFAVNSYSDNGFSGNIQVMVGFDMGSNVINYAVLSHAETPGLGSQMTSWFKPQVHESSLIERIFGFEMKKAEVKSSIIGKNPATTQFAVSKDGGDIDAISASTVTSRAFLEAINKAYVAYAQSNDYASTGATINASEDSIEINE